MAVKIEETEIDLKEEILKILLDASDHVIKRSVDDIILDLKKAKIVYDESELASALEDLFKEGKIKSVDSRVIPVKAEVGSIKALVMSDFAAVQ